MKGLISRFEKYKPLFEKLSRNIYLRAIRDGFIAGMPVVLFSSIFILIAFVPEAFGFKWSEDVINMLMNQSTQQLGNQIFGVEKIIVGEEGSWTDIRLYPVYNAPKAIDSVDIIASHFYRGKPYILKTQKEIIKNMAYRNF